MSHTELLKKFQEDLPRYMYASDDFGKYGVQLVEKRIAITKEHLTPNTFKRKSFLIFDVDRCDGMLAPLDADLPAPSFSMRNPANGHAHHAWQLKTPVIFGSNGRIVPQKFFKDICLGFLVQLSADPAYNQRLMKNPLHLKWETQGTGKLYELDELKEYISNDLNELKRNLLNPKGTTDLSSRTITLFDLLRAWAYANVEEYKRVDNYKGFIDHANRQAEYINEYNIRNIFKGSVLNSYSHVVRSVTDFAWNKYSGRLDDKLFAAIQQKKSVKYWGNNSEAKKLVHKLLGEGLSRAEIARRTGFHYNTIKSWCRA